VVMITRVPPSFRGNGYLYVPPTSTPSPRPLILCGWAPVGAEAVVLHAARVPLGPLGAGPRVALVRCNFSLPPQAPQTEKELERAADVDRGRAETVRDVVPVWKSTSENRHCHANEP